MKTQVSTYLNASLANQLKQIARMQEMSTSSMLGRIVEHFLSHVGKLKNIQKMTFSEMMAETDRDLKDENRPVFHNAENLISYLNGAKNESIVR